MQILRRSTSTASQQEELSSSGGERETATPPTPTKLMAPNPLSASVPSVDQSFSAPPIKNETGLIKSESAPVFNDIEAPKKNIWEDRKV